MTETADERRARKDALASESWRYDPVAEEMARQAEQDPQQFAAVFGPKGHVTVGLYAEGKARAARSGIDVTKPHEEK